MDNLRQAAICFLKSGYLKIERFASQRLFTCVSYTCPWSIEVDYLLSVLVVSLTDSTPVMVSARSNANKGNTFVKLVSQNVRGLKSDTRLEESEH